MGKVCKQRRDVGFFSDVSKGYNYSTQKMPALPLSTSIVLPHILYHTNLALGTNFNGLLINRYHTGEQYISAHSDDEKGLDKNHKMVASLCYGPGISEAHTGRVNYLGISEAHTGRVNYLGIRTFRIRNKTTKEIVLDHQHLPCSLLVMEGEFQREFTHEIPIQKKIKEDRISVTFRTHAE